MDTLRAINNMAMCEASGLDGARSPGGATLRKQAEGMQDAAQKAIILTAANEMNPDSDRATQIRLASAIDRQIAGEAGRNSSEIARAILNDFYLQEAAARRLVLSGDRDPLAHQSNPESARDNDRSFEVLSRNGISAGLVMKLIGKEDAAAISTGRYSEVTSERTRFAVQSVLGLSAEQMAVRSAGADTAVTRASAAQLPMPRSIGVPTRAMPSPAIFGRKAGAER